jgi:hypothetical protein
VARRIIDRDVLHLIKMWLKAPVEERDEKGNGRMTGGKGSKQGTPQGGVASPLTYNWWGIYTRMGTADKHREAMTTRPSLMEGVAQQTEHARTVKLKMTSVHGKARAIAEYLRKISNYLRRFLDDAEQLEPAERWPTTLRQIFWKFCGGTRPLEGGSSLQTAG